MKTDTPTTSAQVASITPELLTTAQAARLAGCGERTFWRWSRSGIAPPPLTIGCGLRPAVRYRRADLLAWIEAGCPRIDGKDGER
jgi:predicted DNA-binding transcriptional regulator AlpA